MVGCVTIQCSTIVIDDLSHPSYYISLLYTGISITLHLQTIDSTQVSNGMTVGAAVKAGGANYNPATDNSWHGASRIMERARK